jgi:hypothetical protein
MPGAYRSTRELVNEALSNLGALANGQVADVDDVAYITANVDPVLRMLAALDVCYVPDPDNIPGELFVPLAAILAEQCAQKFGSSSDDFAKLTQKGLGVPPGSGAGAMAIKQMTRGRYSMEPLRVFYY